MMQIKELLFMFSFFSFKKYGCFPQMPKRTRGFHSASKLTFSILHRTNYELLMIMIWGNYIRYGRLVNIYVYIFLTNIFEIEGCLGKNRQHPFEDDIDVKIDSLWNSNKRYTPFHIFRATCTVFMDLAISPTLQ